ncbi:MAG TPA: hypothetical protein P5534_14225 [Candidatus Paceibacterota bacterium]|nr:hypothetical protein [Candidatus Paceibacterota bacterium]
MAQERKPAVHDRLTAYAAERRRRLGPPPTLPPHTRRFLLDAVSRHYEPVSAQARPQHSGWIGGWMRWAWTGAALVAVIAGALWMVRHPRLESTLEVARKVEPIDNAQVLATVPPPPMAAHPTPSELPLARTSDGPTPPAVLASAPSTAPSHSERGVAFKTGDPASFGVAGALPVLRRFRIEGDGETIRIVDADGSVYEGTLLAAAKPMMETVEVGTALRGRRTAQEGAVPPGARAARKGFTAGQPRMAAPPTQGPTSVGSRSDLKDLAFEVRGTNRSLNQSVRLSGQFVLTNRPIASPTQIERRADGLLDSFKDLVRQSAVQGQAVLGDGRILQINATPESP